MSFEVSLEKFAGPLQLLLEIVEGEKLPITEVSLAKVADDYLRYVEGNDVPSEELADFLVLATKLLLLKSRAILPALPTEEEVDGSQLAAQLRMYKEFVEASRGIEAMWLSPSRMFVREKMKSAAVPAFSPPRGVTPQALADAFAHLLKRLEPFFSLRQAAMERVVSVQ
jgi:segregation and condensation protein A